MIAATVGPGELIFVAALVLWPTLSWWAIKDILARRDALARRGHPPLVWLVIAVLPLAGPYLYLRIARRRGGGITIGA